MKSDHSCVKPNAKCTQHQRRKTLLKHRTMDITSMNKCLHAMNLSPTSYHDQSIVK